MLNMGTVWQTQTSRLDIYRRVCFPYVDCEVLARTPVKTLTVVLYVTYSVSLTLPCEMCNETRICIMLS